MPLPQEFERARNARLGLFSALASSSGKATGRVTARVENDVVGVCPVCQRPMDRTVAMGHAIYWCTNDRVTMPLENGAT